MLWTVLTDFEVSLSTTRQRSFQATDKQLLTGWLSLWCGGSTSLARAVAFRVVVAAGAVFFGGGTGLRAGLAFAALARVSIRAGGSSSSSGSSSSYYSSVTAAGFGSPCVRLHVSKANLNT